MSDNKETIPMDNIINTILDKKFRKVGHDGYSDSEVDAFLDAICDVVEALQAEMENVRQQLNEANTAKEALETKLQNTCDELAAARSNRQQYAAPVQPAAVSNTTSDDVKEILEMAQQLKAQTIAKAQAQADKLVEDAKVQAQAQLGDLTMQRDSLQKQVADLKETADGVRSKLLTLIEETKMAVEDSKL